MGFSISNISTTAVRLISKSGVVLSWAAPILVLLNLYHEFAALDSYYRVSTSILCFVYALLIAIFSPKAGIAACILALPLLPNFSFELTAFTGYGRIAQSQYPGLDLVAGLFLGVNIHQVVNKNKKVKANPLLWPAYILLVYLSISVTIAITRNLHQSHSDFNFSALAYNVLHLRSIDWHNDYRPFVDWVIYGNATIFLVTASAVLATSGARNHFVFIPLITTILISTVIAIFQSQLGIGLQWFHYFFRVDQLGYVALGLQPDIHAFAGFMLIGALGLWGYVYSLSSRPYRWLIVATVIPAAWISLFLSKSKSTIILALAFLILQGLIWSFRHSKNLSRVITGILISSILFVITALYFKEYSALLLSKLIPNLGIKDLADLNLKLVYRPEIFAAALKMFSMFPLLGMGQGEFYHQSANYQLTNSHFLSIEQNGENAHNYFLQTLVETGLIGFVIFALVIIYPIYKSQHKKLLVPALIGLGSVFIGNLYSHSMLVRENLFIAIGLLALIYAWVLNEQNPVTEKAIISAKFIEQSYAWLVISALAFLVLLSLKELKDSFKSFPFTIDTQCYRNKEVTVDGWTSGLFEMSIPQGSTEITIAIKATRPSLGKRGLPATISILDNSDTIISSKDFVFSEQSGMSVSIALPNHETTTSENYRVELRLGYCFVPRNINLSSDQRRLGIQILSTTSK